MVIFFLAADICQHPQIIEEIIEHIHDPDGIIHQAVDLSDAVVHRLDILLECIISCLKTVYGQSIAIHKSRDTVPLQPVNNIFCLIHLKGCKIGLTHVDTGSCQILNIGRILRMIENIPISVINLFQRILIIFHAKIERTHIHMHNPLQVRQLVTMG